jgi:hypothetical protein
MADIKDLKITEDKTRGKHVADLPVNPTENGMSAQELQGHFDALPKLAIEAFNDLVDALEENGAGDKITPQSVGARPNANLLHNWYFGNPVNRNGKTEYTSARYTIDRWQSLNGSTLTLTEDGIRFRMSAGQQIQQTLDDYSALYNKNITCSILLADGTLHSGTIRYDADSNWDNKTFFYMADMHVLMTDVHGFVFYSNNAVDVTMLAVKLELGDQQTLAHQENGVWVLNEIPDYAEQMAICMQYDKTTGAYTGITASDVGAIPFINAQGASWDMDAVLKSGWHCAFYETNSNTLNTPYKLGKTTAAAATILSYSNAVNFGTQIAFLSANLFMIRKMSNGIITEWSYSFLPLDGSVPMSGNLTVANGYCLVRGDESGTVIDHKDADGWDNNTQLALFKGADLAGIARLYHRKNGELLKEYNIFGQHNKPSGSYTGNGSETERKIEIGGIGNVLFIKDVRGECCAYVWANGAIMSDNGTISASVGHGRFKNGVLTLDTTKNALNANSVTYEYQVL